MKRKKSTRSIRRHPAKKKTQMRARKLTVHRKRTKNARTNPKVNRRETVTMMHRQLRRSRSLSQANALVAQWRALRIPEGWIRQAAFTLYPSLEGRDHRKSKSGKRNPDNAVDLYTQFHGRGPNRVKELEIAMSDAYARHPELAQLGRLVSLVVGEGIKVEGSDGNDIEKIDGADPCWSREITFPPPEAPDVAAEPNGRQLYFVGGKQTLTDDALRALGADPSKDLIDLGYCYRIEYFTEKRFDKFQPVTYWHLLGEETGVIPRLLYSKDTKTLSLAGGEYVVKPEGIVN